MKFNLEKYFYQGRVYWLQWGVMCILAILATNAFAFLSNGMIYHFIDDNLMQCSGCGSFSVPEDGVYTILTYGRRNGTFEIWYHENSTIFSIAEVPVEPLKFRHMDLTLQAEREYRIGKDLHGSSNNLDPRDHLWVFNYQNALQNSIFLLIEASLFIIALGVSVVYSIRGDYWPPNNKRYLFIIILLIGLLSLWFGLFIDNSKFRWFSIGILVSIALNILYFIGRYIINKLKEQLYS